LHGKPILDPFEDRESDYRTPLAAAENAKTKEMQKVVTAADSERLLQGGTGRTWANDQEGP